MMFVVFVCRKCARTQQISPLQCRTTKVYPGAPAEAQAAQAHPVPPVAGLAPVAVAVAEPGHRCDRLTQAAGLMLRAAARLGAHLAAAPAEHVRLAWHPVAPVGVLAWSLLVQVLLRVPAQAFPGQVVQVPPMAMAAGPVPVPVPAVWAVPARRCDRLAQAVAPAEHSRWVQAQCGVAPVGMGAPVPLVLVAPQALAGWEAQ